LPVKKFFAEFLRIPLCAWERFHLFGRWSFSPGVTPAIIPLFLVRSFRAARSFYPVIKEFRLGLTLMHRLQRVNRLFLARQWPLGALFRPLEALTDRWEGCHRLLDSLQRLLIPLSSSFWGLSSSAEALSSPARPLSSSFGGLSVLGRQQKDDGRAQKGIYQGATGMAVSQKGAFKLYLGVNDAGAPKVG
jgi:hypothetical protein